MLFRIHPTSVGREAVTRKELIWIQGTRIWETASSWLEQFAEQLKNNSMSYDPSVPLLGIHPDKMIIWEDARIPVFTAEPFTITKTWKQLKRPLSDEWIKKTWHIWIRMYATSPHTWTDTVEYYSATKKNEPMPSAAHSLPGKLRQSKWKTRTWMDLEIIILSEVGPLRKTSIWHHLYVQSKIRQKRTYLWSRNRLTDTETRMRFPKGQKGGGVRGGMD